MSGNSFGNIFKVTTFGESHGAFTGCIIDGCPSGVKIDMDFIQGEMNRRRPGTGNSAVSSRNESDEIQIVSGVLNNVTTGTPIAILIPNENQNSKDYEEIKDKFRPGHADFTYQMKYGLRDWKGGGRSSGRETAARTAAGAVAKLFLAGQNISIKAYTVKAAGISCTRKDLSEIDENELRCPDNEAAELMLEKINELRQNNDSAGGIVECSVKGLPAGSGEPVFDKIEALLSHAVMSIGSIKGIEFGKGFECADMTGSQFNDELQFDSKTNTVKFLSNNSGGILGGISNGDEIIFRVAVKPVPSISKKQKTIDVNFENCEIITEGRHDVCLCPRIVPVIEAMTAITLADLFLQNRCSKQGV